MTIPVMIDEHSPFRTKASRMIGRPRRSVLYMPASNARAIDKARNLPCDVVILDLEDAVAHAVKVSARTKAVEAVSQGGFGRNGRTHQCAGQRMGR